MHKGVQSLILWHHYSEREGRGGTAEKKQEFVLKMPVLVHLYNAMSHCTESVFEGRVIHVGCAMYS